jgi:hypothetical protein
MKKYLFIDDLRTFNRISNYDLYIVRNYEEAISALKINSFDIISFDHDLGEEKTGYDIAKYIVENDIEIKEGFKIHSANPVGRFNISQLLNHYGYKEL